MSTPNCFFSHAPSSNSPFLVFDSQVYSLRILLVSDAALCICSGEDRTRSRHKLQHEEDIDATVTAGKPASVPSALFSSLSHTSLY